jgi:nucleotide-binding universal stress UspA family protein
MADRILVPLDGSPRSELILSQIGRLLRHADAEVLLLRVLPPDGHPMGSPESVRLSGEREVAQKYVSDLVERFRGRGARIWGRVIRGEAAPAILETAEIEGSSLIAMTTHGRTGLRRWVLGSVAEKVVRQSPVPVLLVRSFVPGPGATLRDASPEELSIRKILLPIDGSPAAEAAVPHAKALAELFGSEILVVHAEYPVVLPGPEVGAFPVAIPTPAWSDAVTEPTADVFQRAGLRVTRVTEIGDPASVILDECDSLGADLIVMATHGRTGAGRWFLGSVAERVLRHAHVPILLVRSGGEAKPEGSVGLKNAAGASR